MFDPLDFLAQLGTFPWLYRGWAFCFSALYRDLRRQQWRRYGSVYKYFDITLSVGLMLLELVIVAGMIATLFIARRS